MTLTVNAPMLRMVWPDEATDLDLAALQGMWSREQYLALTDQTNRPIEYTDGVIEVLPMPTDQHQAISLFLLLGLLAFIRPRGGVVHYAPLRLEVRPGTFREPDLLLLLRADDPRRQNAYWRGADLVVEIVSPDDPSRDTEVKPRDYAEAGIPEYWIVNPLTASVTVLVLADASYVTYGQFGRGEEVRSRLLEGFRIAVQDLLDAR